MTTKTTTKATPMTKIDPDDPRWTAYALGELSESERAELDAIVSSDPDARAYVDGLRETADLLARELESQPGKDVLTDLQRRRIDKAAAARPRRRWLAFCAVGACAASAAGVMMFSTSRSQDAASSPRSPNGDVSVASSASGASGKDGVAVSSPHAVLAPGPQSQLEPPPPPVGGAVTADELGFYGYHDGQSADGLYLRTGGEKRATLALNHASDGDFSSGVDGFDDDGVESPNTEQYAKIDENDFVAVADDARSTFSIDVDTASYANVRRHLRAGQRPPAGAVRIEELINYFDYDYAAPAGEDPFAIHSEATRAPWNPEHMLVRVGIKGKTLPDRRRARANLVFLIDVSGSMEDPAKLPLVKESMKLLIEQLDVEDRIAIVVYAGAAGVALPSTPIGKKQRILRAIDELGAGGSTNGGAGIRAAYDIAAKHFVKGGVNRVLLATDGDFNVGVSSDDQLVALIEKKAKTGVFLTVLGYGMGNYKDSTLEQIADRGNGHYAYIDTLNEARKLLVDGLDATLVTIAKDVKIQVEFNPKRVGHFRLIGYENRALAHRDFNDDKKDAGEVGAGHSVTALYELVPPGMSVDGASTTDSLKYQKQVETTAAADSDELFTIKLRYKEPAGERSRLMEHAVAGSIKRLEAASTDTRFAAAVAAFGMVLRSSKHVGTFKMSDVRALASRSLGGDRYGYRDEFLELVERAR